MSDRLPSGFVTNREIGATATDPIDASKLVHLYKECANFGYTIGGFSETFQIGTRAKIGATAGWAVPAADNLPYVATLPASQSGSTLIIPIDGLKIDDTITGFRVVAQVASAGGSVTIDGDLRATTNVAAEPTDASIGTMTQVSVTANTAVSQSKTDLTEIVTSGKTYYLKLTATTAASTDIILQACEITVTRGTVPVTKEVVLFVADKAGTILEVGAGLEESGTNTSIAFDLINRPSTSFLSSTISVTHSTGDRTEVTGTISGTGAYSSGAVVSAKMTVTSAVGAHGPWLRIVRTEDGD